MNFRALGMAVAVGAASAWSAPATASAGQTMPACAAGDTVVWENTSTKVYHLKGDKYFGTTKSGAYACKSAADAAGYHASGEKSGGMAAASAAPDAVMSPSAMASPAGKHHHHHKKGAAPSASPAAGVPAGTPIPAAT